MAKRTSSGRKPKRKSTRKRKLTASRKTKSKSKLTSKAWFFTGPFLLALLIAFFAKLYRGVVLNYAYEISCKEPTPGDYASSMIYNAINLQHQIVENKSKKIELMKYLNDDVIWFRKSRKESSKFNIRIGSAYDKFCFAELPVYDIKDEMNRNFELRFVGKHRLRSPDSIYSVVEKYYCKIVNGKISSIYPIKINKLDEESFSRNNFFFNNLFLTVLVIAYALIMIGRFILSLPIDILKWIGDLFKKILPI